MRLQKRNSTEFEYLPYSGLETDLDDDGLHTGVFVPQYDDPIKYRGNISSPSGAAVQAFDGLEIRYSHILLMDNPNVDIQETGKVRYRGKMYTVTAVRPSLNVFCAALLADAVDHGDQYVGDED